MRYLYTKLLLLTTLLTLLIVNGQVFATSWAEIEPQKVQERASVIVKGTYNFSSNPKMSEFIFRGYEFNVTAVFRGESSNTIIAGIDMYDVGWASDFQDNGGEFLLFLEKNEEADFLIPVGGPNGMVQVLEGQVVNQSQEKKRYYQEILNRESELPTNTQGTMDRTLQTNSYSIYFVIGGIIVFLVVGLLLIRNFKEKNKKNR